MTAWKATPWWHFRWWLRWHFRDPYDALDPEWIADMGLPPREEWK